MAQLNVNLDAVEASQSFAPIPVGRYLAIVSDSELKRTKAGDGEYLALKFQIIDGDQNGRLHWENLNISNPNPEAERIAHQNLKALAQAVGAYPLTDSLQLHDRPVYIDLKADKKDAERRVIKGYTAAAGASAPAPFAAPKPSAPATQPAGKPTTGATVPPWKKG